MSSNSISDGDGGGTCSAVTDVSFSLLLEQWMTERGRLPTPLVGLASVCALTLLWIVFTSLWTAWNDKIQQPQLWDHLHQGSSPKRAV